MHSQTCSLPIFTVKKNSFSTVKSNGFQMHLNFSNSHKKTLFSSLWHTSEPTKC
uniref:Uncharacterized protein n=1 Tax=Anguilla anguilla TaxID=7936 RepID=A0A0E9PKQ3_ANGAN